MLVFIVILAAVATLAYQESSYERKLFEARKTFAARDDEIVATKAALEKSLWESINNYESAVGYEDSFTAAQASYDSIEDALAGLIAEMMIEESR